MRVPTFAMKQAGGASINRAAREQVYAEAVADLGWQAMIDVALAEKPA